MNVTLKNINIQVFLFYPIKKEVDLLDIIVYNVYLSSCFNLLPIYIYIYIYCSRYNNLACNRKN